MIIRNSVKDSLYDQQKKEFIFRRGDVRRVGIADVEEWEAERREAEKRSAGPRSPDTALPTAAGGGLEPVRHEAGRGRGRGRKCSQAPERLENLQIGRAFAK